MRCEDSDRPEEKFSDGKVAKRFAAKLHGYSNLSLNDIVKLCQRGGVMNAVLHQALKQAVKKCSSCKSTGRPKICRKVSFGSILTSFNEHVQLDYFFIAEIGKNPILHLVDTNTAFFATALMDSKEMEPAAKEFELKWINVHGPPAIVSTDLEFSTRLSPRRFGFLESRYSHDQPDDITRSESSKIRTPWSVQLPSVYSKMQRTSRATEV